MRWYVTALKKYGVFRGRARRREYWMFLLVHVVLLLLATAADMTLGAGDDDIGVVAPVYLVATMLPSLAVGVRRLHDTGRRGWWILLNAVPVVGSVVVFVLSALDGTPGDNRYGSSPKSSPA